MNGLTSMDVSLTDQQYGPARTGQPYPMSNLTHNHPFGSLADHHSMLESRILRWKHGLTLCRRRWKIGMSGTRIGIHYFSCYIRYLNPFYGSLDMGRLIRLVVMRLYEYINILLVLALPLFA